MKLLLDANLSPRLAAALQDLFPGTAHVREFGLQSVDDEPIWRYAIEHGFAIASKDSDFRQRSFVLGAPPKVIWIRCGNCSTDEIERLIRARHPDIDTFEQDAEETFLVVSW